MGRLLARTIDPALVAVRGLFPDSRAEAVLPAGAAVSEAQAAMRESRAATYGTAVPLVQDLAALGKEVSRAGAVR